MAFRPLNTKGIQEALRQPQTSPLETILGSVLPMLGLAIARGRSGGGGGGGTTATPAAPAEGNVPAMPSADTIFSKMLDGVKLPPSTDSLIKPLQALIPPPVVAPTPVVPPVRAPIPKPGKWITKNGRRVWCET